MTWSPTRASPPSAGSSSGPPTWSCRTAGRSPASTATASPAGSCCPGCSATSWWQAFGQFKAIFDPDNRMNPGKVVAPYRLDENLRLGTSWAPRDDDTYFRFPDDDGRFERAVLRCVGVGKCRHDRRRRDVPVVHGHPRGGALHPRPQPAAVRDAGGARRLAGHRRLALDRGPGRSGPVPGVQGLQAGLPGRGRHGHDEGRVPGSSLPGPAPPAGALLHGLAAGRGRARRTGAPAGQRADPGAGPADGADRGRRHRPAPAHPAVRRPDLPGLGRGPRRRGRPGCAARSCSGRTRSPTI